MLKKSKVVSGIETGRTKSKNRVRQIQREEHE